MNVFTVTFDQFNVYLYTHTHTHTYVLFGNCRHTLALWVCCREFL